MEDLQPTILIVDDTEDNLDLMEFALKRKPVHMLRASSGKECLQVAAQNHPDVILLDIQMPEMDGFETLKHLRASKKTVNIPVIFLTAQRKDASSIEQGFSLGVDEYLTKPIDIDELLLEGFDPADRYRIGDAFAAELTRLVGEYQKSSSGGVPPQLTNGFGLTRLSAGSFQVAQGASPERIGVQVAGALWESVRVQLARVEPLHPNT